MSEINLEQIRDKLYNRLVPSGWAGVLKSFMLSQDMMTILEKLMEESGEGKKFTPKLSQVFRAFEECPYDKLKVVVILQDPYPGLVNGINVADGIAMSVSNTNKIQPSLQYVHTAIEETVYPLQKWNGPLDLKIWANQGVLLLNVALTTTVGKTGVHYTLWRPFVVHLLDMLSWSCGGLVYCYMGKKAADYSKVTNDNCYKLYVSHPASAAYNNTAWDSQGVFPKINELLKKSGSAEIVW